MGALHDSGVSLSFAVGGELKKVGVGSGVSYGGGPGGEGPPPPGKFF